MKNTCLVALFVMLLPGSLFVGQTKPVSSNASKFWTSLQNLCGKAFTGEVAHAPQNDTTFKGKKLVMHVRSCEQSRIKIPFFIGEDKSRVWVLTRLNDGILLKHEHRHSDGTLDKITNYGGRTTTDGSLIRQLFPADQETVDILPAALSNVWWIDLVPGEHFIYNLRRVGTDRFYSVKFDLTKEAKTPGKPWGWDSSSAQSLKPPRRLSVPLPFSARSLLTY